MHERVQAPDVLHTEQDREDHHAGDRPLAQHEPGRQQPAPDLVEHGEEAVGRGSHEEGREPHREERLVDGLGEEAGLRALDRVRREEADNGEEVGEELEDDEGVGDADCVGGRGLVGAELGPAVDEVRDLDENGVSAPAVICEAAEKTYPAFAVIDLLFVPLGLLDEVDPNNVV